MESIVPGILFLIFISLLSITVLCLFSKKVDKLEFKQNEYVMFGALFLFLVTMGAHLLQPQDWTGDILKVIIGVVAGVAVTSYVSIGTVNGDMAMRDFHKTIKNMESDFTDMRNAIIHQHGGIDDANFSFLFNWVSKQEFDDSFILCSGLADVVDLRKKQGWVFRQFFVDRYHDGIFVIFSKKRTNEDPSFLFFHGDSTKNDSSLVDRL